MKFILIGMALLKRRDHPKVLLCWLGATDLKAAFGETYNGRTYTYPQVLLSVNVQFTNQPVCGW
jgi:hypothetical protein